MFAVFCDSRGFAGIGLAIYFGAGIALMLCLVTTFVWMAGHFMKKRKLYLNMKQIFGDRERVMDVDVERILGYLRSVGNCDTKEVFAEMCKFYGLRTSTSHEG